MSGTVSSGGVEPEQQLVEPAGERDVVRVHERRDREPRPVARVPARARRTARPPARRTRRRARCRSRTSPRRGARGRSTRRTRTGRAGRPCGRPRPPRRSASPSSSEAIRPSWLPGIDEVGVADVPLAAVVGLVAAGAEPVAERRHRVGVEPPHRRVGVLLRDAVGLRHAVQRRVLAGEQRRPARHARRRARVVPVELQPAVAERLPGRQLRRGGTPPPRRVSYGGGYRSSSVMISRMFGEAIPGP